MAVVDWINMFALAVNENAAGGRVVTAPTNGACGIVPAVLAYYDKFIRQSERQLAGALYAGHQPLLYKMNASISGAEVGCQGEVGVACSMAAAGLAELLAAVRVRYASRRKLVWAQPRSHLRSGCRPGAGAASSVSYRSGQGGQRRAYGPAPHQRAAGCLDKVIGPCNETGKDMNAKYRETSRGGLAMKFVACD